MSEVSMKEELLKELSRMGESDRRRVLEYARSLSTGPVRGVPGTALLSHLGSIPEAEANEIAGAIEEGCEKVDLDAW